MGECQREDSICQLDHKNKKTPEAGNLEYPEEAKKKKANKPKTTGEKEHLGMKSLKNQEGWKKTKPKKWGATSNNKSESHINSTLHGEEGDGPNEWLTYQADGRIGAYQANNG